MNRTHLPGAGQRPPYTAAQDARDQRDPLPPREQPAAPEGAPNVLVILLDDMGFGAASAFGGPCRMPVADALARDGLRYTRFHTTALCSPTRAALLTGRNHHDVGMGAVVEMSNGTPGYDGMRPPSVGTMAQTLSYNGYATAAFGKWHQTPPWEQTAAGPFDRWPTREGFDRFYGFLGGEADQYSPSLVEGTTFVDPPRTPEQGYHLSEDLAEKTIDWVDDITTFGGGKPWFCYLAFGATHAPLQVPSGWAEDYRGEFGMGWDALREVILARQKEIGVVPGDAELAPWPPGVPHWDELTDPQRVAAERLMETYCGFAEHTDAQVGRVIEALRASGQLENTVVMYILGDNGASPEGGYDGTLNETLRFNGVDDTAERVIENLELIGGPHSYPHYPSAWAVSMDTPYAWTKQVASHYGGTRNGLIVHWPNGIDEPGLRHQWHHVVDVYPTILELAGLPVPERIDGVVQEPLAGGSMAYTLNDADADEQHLTQYFEIFGNRGIYHRGWTAVTMHKDPFIPPRLRNLGPMADDVWELYDTRSDWTQARDVAREYPDKLAELQQLFVAEATRYQVFPMDDGGSSRMNAALAGRQTKARTTVRLRAGAGHLREDAVPNLKNTSFAIRARFAVDGGTAGGVLIAQGGRFAGWSLYMRDNKLTYAYNFLGLELTHVTGAVELMSGEHLAEVVFAYDGGGLGRGGTATLFLDGTEVGAGRIEKTVPNFFSMDQTMNVGIDRGSPVTDDYLPGVAGFPFTGTIRDVTIEVGDDAVHPSAQQLLRATMVIQ